MSLSSHAMKGRDGTDQMSGSETVHVGSSLCVCVRDIIVYMLEGMIHFRLKTIYLRMYGSIEDKIYIPCWETVDWLRLWFEQVSRKWMLSLCKFPEVIKTSVCVWPFNLGKHCVRLNKKMTNFVLSTKKNFSSSERQKHITHLSAYIY